MLDACDSVTLVTEFSINFIFFTRANIEFILF